MTHILEYYTTWVCILVALGIQRAMRMRHIVVCGVPRATIFSTLSHKRHYCLKKVTKLEICVLIFSTTFSWNISHSKRMWARYDKKYILVFMSSAPYSCPILIKFEFSRQIFEKSSNIKFDENLPSGRRAVPCGRKDRRTDRHLQFAISRTPLNPLRYKPSEITMYSGLSIWRQKFVKTSRTNVYQYTLRDDQHK